MGVMDLAPIPLIAAQAARERCIVRGERLVRVKFIGLPAEGMLEVASGETRASGLWGNISRVIGRLVAARP
jgi:hypothetical protein